MFIDFRSLPSDVEIETDLCIIGAGVAGISIAQEFLGTGIRVCLIESGGLEAESETQSLYAGEVTGFSHTPLEDSRMRFFGGSSNCWKGRCAPFEKEDFEPRSWVPHSGWPISRSDLDPYYARAQTICQLGPPVYDNTLWQRLRLVRPALDEDRLRPYFWQLSPPVRFGDYYREPLRTAQNVRTFFHANVVDIETNHTTHEVTAISLRGLNGITSKVRAAHYVLATGGIENARLLLASNSVDQAGLGNRYDRVGRFFMEHPYSICGMAISRDSPLLSSYSKRLGDVLLDVGLATSVKTQEREGVLGAVAVFDPDQNVDRLFKRRGPLPSAPEGSVRLALVSQSEQAPDPESRVTLAAERDALGLKRSCLSWNLSSLDKRSISVMVEQIGIEFARTGLGRVQLADWLIETDAFWGIVDGNHHMGTTRMGENPRLSVVDGNCQIHGINNLSVAGSSVFVTSGVANPTLTIVALALRLADRLKNRFAAVR